MSLNTGELGGNPYLNFLISAAVEVIAATSQLFVYRIFGRIFPYSTCMFVGGVVFLTISVIGKF